MRDYAGEGWSEDGATIRWQMNRYTNSEWCPKRLARTDKQVFRRLATA
jgi:hypothetical protein